MNNTICLNCKTNFLTYKKKQKFCCSKCFAQYNKSIIIKNLTNRTPPKHRPWDGKKRPDFAGSKHPLWKGGRQKSGYGYVQIYMPNHPKAHKNTIPEHRYLIEQHLGRKLKSSEIVHHLNGNKLDNRIENLMIITRAQHMKLHKISRWKEKIDLDSLALITSRRAQEHLFEPRFK